MVPILLATYGTVFLAEIAGDRLLYTVGVLSTRYRTESVLFGIAVAFVAKMGVAVAVGSAISELPPLLVATITTLSFVGVAVSLWFEPADRPGNQRENAPVSRVAMVSFATIFFSEWGDVGQITAATMAARFGAPLVVWAGAVAAMVTKGTLVALAGAGIRKWIADRVSPQIVRYVSVSLLLSLGALSVIETLTVGHS